MATNLFCAAGFVSLGLWLACVTTASEAQLSVAAGDDLEGVTLTTEV